MSRQNPEMANIDHFIAEDKKKLRKINESVMRFL